MNDPLPEIAALVLKELEFSDMTTLQLVRRLSIGVSRLKPELKRMEKAHQIRVIQQGEDDVWRLN